MSLSITRNEVMNVLNDRPFFHQYFLLEKRIKVVCAFLIFVMLVSTPFCSHAARISEPSSPHPSLLSMQCSHSSPLTPNLHQGDSQL